MNANHEQQLKLGNNNHSALNRKTTAKRRKPASIQVYVLFNLFNNIYNNFKNV